MNTGETKIEREDLRYLESASILAMQSLMRKRGHFKMVTDEAERKASFDYSSSVAWDIAMSMLNFRNQIKNEIENG